MEDIVAALPRGGGLRGRAFAVAGAGRQVEAVLSWSEARRVETALRPSARLFVRYVFSSPSPTSLASWQIYWTEEITFFTPREGGRRRREEK